MKTWQVERVPNHFEKVLAKTFDIRNGCLLFYSDVSMTSSYLVIGYAADEWITFFLDD